LVKDGSTCAEILSMHLGSKDIVKRKWQKPVLIVLARSRPEEAVLLACKYPGQGYGPIGNNCKEGNAYCSASARS